MKFKSILLLISFIGVSYSDTISIGSLADLAKLRIPYIQHIAKNSAKYSLEPIVVAAIIKQESRFNSSARSNRNAIGLMQVVGNSAGHDVNRVIFGQDKPISDSILYNPYNNIKIGCAYLYFLRKTYFSGIQDSLSMKYCMIAAYNTGTANLVKSFINAQDTNTVEYNKLNGYAKFIYKIDVMTTKINGSDHNNVRNMLIQKLPYEETVTYLNNILDYIEDYETVALNGY